MADCDETRKLIHAYSDGELDLIRSLEIEEHLQRCTACSQMLKNLQALRASMRSSALYFQPPAQLQDRVRSSIREAGKAKPAPRTLPWGQLVLAAVLVLAVGLVWLLGRGFAPAVPGDSVGQEVVASHVRSLMPGHLQDVASTDKHTVKPWFDGRLDFSPPVEDFASRGFPLLGGRMDYIDNRPVAALIYGRQKHIINVFVWPSPGAPASGATAVQASASQGYNVLHWDASGMTFWAVSDLNNVELGQFVQLVRGEAPAPQASPTP